SDPHGRIKVRFHWDRETPQDDTSSCWVRVAQSWAGPSYGVMFIPRVGMEVVVDFLDGNPDRPLVVGCVYNGANPPPYDLPASKTKSTIKTTSSEGGEGFNEFRLEDAKGSEEVFLHAQKDFNEKVLNNHSTSVTANQTNSVGGSQSESVGGNQSMTVTGKRTKHVKKTETNTVDEKRETKLGADDILETKGLTKQKLISGLQQTVTQFAKLTLSDLYQIDVKGQQKITVDGTSSLSVTNTHDAMATNHFAIGQGKSGTDAALVLEGKSAAMNALTKITLAAKTDQAAIELKNDGKLAISAATEISISVGGSTIVLDAKGVSVGGTKVGLTGGKAGSVTLDAKGAVVSGPEVKSLADAANTVMGAIVKIN
ncbi:MAG: type VI secretion system tip protein VgrG, partial [Deltaproteobacteria bacterium]|nr:type VI secretion system tip protein VgrG [Deltaproteobacteria bacterium]